MFTDPPFDASLSVTIMYAGWDEFRCENAAVLYDQLVECPEVESVRKHRCSKDRLLWHDSRDCWRDGLDTDATHHMVIQGDVELCEGFATAFTNALGVVPNRIVSPFSAYVITEQAYEQGVPWARSTGKVWGQAPCVPSHLVADFLEWNEMFFDPENKHDDIRLGCWNTLEYERDIWFTAPSLVEHLGHDESVAGNNPPIDRDASIYVGDTDVAPNDIEWRCDPSTVPTMQFDITEKCLSRLDL